MSSVNLTSCHPTAMAVVALSASGLYKGICVAAEVLLVVGFDADALQANECALDAVGCTRGRTSQCHQHGRKHHEGYFLPLPCQHAALKREERLGRAKRPRRYVAGADGSSVVH